MSTTHKEMRNANIDRFRFDRRKQKTLNNTISKFIDVN